MRGWRPQEGTGILLNLSLNDEFVSGYFATGLFSSREKKRNPGTIRNTAKGKKGDYENVKC